MTTADRFDPDSFRQPWKRTLNPIDASATQTIPRVADHIYVGRHRHQAEARRLSLRAMFHVARHRA